MADVARDIAHDVHVFLEGLVGVLRGLCENGYAMGSSLAGDFRQWSASPVDVCKANGVGIIFD